MQSAGAPAGGEPPHGHCTGIQGGLARAATPEVNEINYRLCCLRARFLQGWASSSGTAVARKHGWLCAAKWGLPLGVLVLLIGMWALRAAISRAWPGWGCPQAGAPAEPVRGEPLVYF